MKSKLNLNAIKVKSFVTAIDEKNRLKVNGGSSGVSGAIVQCGPGSELYPSDCCQRAY